MIDVQKKIQKGAVEDFLKSIPEEINSKGSQGSISEESNEGFIKKFLN